MFRKILTKYLLVWLTVVCLISFFWKNVPGTAGIVDPFTLNGGMMKGLIATAMLVIGSLLPLEEVKMVAKRWPLILGGTAVQYVSMPLLAWVAAHLFHLEGPYFIGIILVGAVPGAMAGNLLTMLSGGNVSYSVGLTTSATLFSPFMIPLLLWLLLGAEVSPEVGPMMLDLFLTVVAPVAIGFTLSRICPLWNRAAQAIGESTGNIVIIWIISAVVAVNRGGFGANVLFLIPPLLFLNFGGYLAGEFGGRGIGIDYRMRRALILEVGMQNAGLGATIARAYFPDEPQAALCCALYTFGCMFTGILLVQVFRGIDHYFLGPKTNQTANLAAGPVSDGMNHDKSGESHENAPLKKNANG